MPVHHGGAAFLRDAHRLEPSRRQCERRHQPCRTLEFHVGVQAGGVAEHVQRGGRRILEKVKEDAVLGFAARDQRMPWRDDMHFVAARRDVFRDRLHERADGIPREPGIRRRHHHDDVAHLSYARDWREGAAGRAQPQPPRHDERFDQHRRRQL